MLQTRTVEPRTLELLKDLMCQDFLKQFSLVGGTALALQLGHRKSIDLDFFTTEDYKPMVIINFLQKKYNLKIFQQTETMLISSVEGIKVDFVKMAYPILFPVTVVEGVRMLDIKDIAPMKLKAIVQRGGKKDFYDMYFLFQQFKLQEILDLFKQKFQIYDLFHVVKSLTYFEDAENDANPILFDESLTWQMVKENMINTINQIN